MRLFNRAPAVRLVLLAATFAAGAALIGCQSIRLPGMLPSTDGQPLEFDAGEQMCVGNYVAARLTKSWGDLPQMTTAQKIAFARAELPIVAAACGLELDVASLTGSQIAGLVEMALYYGLAEEG